MRKSNSSVDEPVPVNEANDFFWLYRQKSIVTMHMAGALIAFFVPVDVLSRFPFASYFVEIVNSALPIVNNFASKSKFIELSQLYGAVMVLTTPYWLLIWFRWPHVNKKEMSMVQLMRSNFLKAMFMPILPIGGVVLTYFVFFVDLQLTEYETMPFHSSRWALALFGPVLYCWIPASGLGLAILGINVLRRYYKGE